MITRNFYSPAAVPGTAILMLGGSLLMGAPTVASASASTIEQLRARFGSDLVLVAPISSVDRALHSAVAMGQSIQLAAADDDSVASLAPNKVAAVIGKVGPDGVIAADSVVALSDTAVDGATELLITGRVTRVNATTGTAKIGHLNVSYAPALYTAGQQVSAGEIVQFLGVNYSMNNLFVADQIQKTSHQSQGLGESSTPALISKGGSMGSGRALGGSMGSGAPTTLTGGSMGSGSPAAVAKGGSMGSGRALGGSMGSGSPTTLTGGSMGSGSPTAIAKGGSMGSGRALGGSMGSGSPTTLTGGSMGSGRALGGSMGSGSPTTLTGGPMGSGSPVAVAKGGSMGSGRALGGSMGSGSPTTLTGGSMGSGAKSISP